MEANLIPAHVQYTGTANTKEYFTNTKSQKKGLDGNENIEGYFRGLRLVGKPIEVSGYLLESKDDGYVAVASFSTFTLFGHDTLEPENQWELINEWYEIGDIIHGD